LKSINTEEISEIIIAMEFMCGGIQLPL